MKIFLSWSGNDSHQVAKILKDFFEGAYCNSIDVFLSSKDLGFTSDDYLSILENIRNSDILISCLTKENHNVMSMLPFEMGAMAMLISMLKEDDCTCQIKNKHNVPFFFDIEPKQIEKGFLKKANGINYKGRADIVSLDQYVFKFCQEYNLSIRRCDADAMFNVIDKTNNKLEKVKASTKTHDFYISYPIKKMSNSEFSISKVLEDVVGTNCFYSKNKPESSPESESLVALYNFKILEKSNKYILIFPSDSNNSSILLEAGIAMYLNKPIKIFTDNESKLPPLIQYRKNLNETEIELFGYENIQIIEYRDLDDLSTRLKKHIE